MSSSSKEEVYDVAVLGAGIQGSATAWYLRKKCNKKVVLIEQFKANHTRGSSHGPSRIIRYMYPEAFYVAMMQRAYPLWSELTSDCGQDLLRTTGGLTTFPNRLDLLEHMKTSLTQRRIPHHLLHSADIEVTFPGLKYPADWTGIYDPDSGILDADASRQAFQSEFVRHGGTLRANCKVDRITPGAEVRLGSIDGDVIRCKRLVVTTGSWSKNLLSEIGVLLPLKTVRINVCYWRATSPNLYGHASKFPVFIHVTPGKKHYYAMPVHEYPGLVKVCAHHGTEIESSDARDTSRQAEDIAEISEFISGHMPGLERQPAIVETCLYTSTPDSHAVMDSHPVWKNIVFGCGFSGHGFKLAPVVGEMLSQLVLGKPSPHDFSPFRADRFSASSKL